METRRRRRSDPLEQKRGSPPRRVRGRHRREEVRREQPAQPTPPPPPPPPPLPSPTPPLPTPPSSPSQQGSSARSPEASGGGSLLPQAPITHRDWRCLVRNVDNIRQRNDYWQEQLDYYRLEQQDEGEREAEVVAEFEPFSVAVREVAIPDNMKNLVLESGRTDPKDHLLYFNTKMVISAASDAVKCRMFPSTFKGTAMAWFTTLPRGSITNFHDFSSKFLVQFSASKIKQVTIDDLYNVRQLEGETLKHYVRRYSAASVKIEELEQQACARAFKNGLLSERLIYSMPTMLVLANAYILDEEDETHKSTRLSLGGREAKSPGGNKRPPSWRGRRSQHGSHLSPRGGGGRLFVGSPGQTRNFQVMKATQMIGGPRAPRRPTKGCDTATWCEYHQLAGHVTEECHALKREIGKMMAAMQPAKGIASTRGDWSSTPSEVGTIDGGFGGGGVTSAARKRNARAVNAVTEVLFGFHHPDITISSAEFFGIKPHLDDPILVLLSVNQLNVQRVLLDQGSSADIIYGDTFDRLGLDDRVLTPYAGSLVGFTGTAY
ncbi:uncharacterized protein LOC130749195 [Lotus japonicus]|uniref:uncharacterized protein LOC130749195 n=1 Tax=Lotus japonicus TaxID=34305 RepID=UPI002582EA68|nr:uncharacterized protein LOC130749195 [Lotus japonicus]